MVVGYKPDHSGHDQAFTTLLQTVKKFKVNLNYDKLQYKQNEVEFLVKPIQQVVTSQAKINWQQLHLCHH